MKDKALVIIDIQNDITKNYKEIIGNINAAIDRAVANDIHVVYIKHNNLSAGTRTFKPDTRGAELASDMKIVSGNIFVKSKGNALTSEGFAAFIEENGIKNFTWRARTRLRALSRPATIWRRAVIPYAFFLTA